MVMKNVATTMANMQSFMQPKGAHRKLYNESCANVPSSKAIFGAPTPHSDWMDRAKNKCWEQRLSQMIDLDCVRRDAP